MSNAQRMPETIVNIVMPKECDDSAPPVWLDKLFFEDILRQHENDKDLDIETFSVKSALGKGENYASVIYRARMLFNSKQRKSECYRSFIIKMLFSDGVAKERLGQYDVHNKEMDIYEFILPEFRKMLLAINDKSAIFPDAVSVNREHEVLVFEDLNEKGYIMPDRVKGFDERHTKMVLDRMAKMHALSIVLNERHKGVFDRFTTGMFTRKTDAFHQFFKTQMQSLINELSKWPGYEYYVKKLNSLRHTFIEKATKVFDREDGDLHVLVHGDLWVNNTLFKYNDNNEPVDVIIIDFQFCAYASPIIDFLYFFYTSTKEDVRFTDLDEYINYYHRNLKNYLIKLNFGGHIPTLHEFHVQFLKKYFYAFTSGAIISPVMINENSENADFEALHGVDERSMQFKRLVYENEKLHKFLKRLLPLCDKKGLLD